MGKAISNPKAFLLTYTWISVVLIHIAATISILNIERERGGPVLNIILDHLSNPGILSLLESRMLINLKEAGQSDVKGSNLRDNIVNTLSDPRFADDVFPYAGISIHLI